VTTHAVGDAERVLIESILPLMKDNYTTNYDECAGFALSIYRKTYLKTSACDEPPLYERSSPSSAILSEDVVTPHCLMIGIPGLSDPSWKRSSNNLLMISGSKNNRGVMI
jgi:hypothetical protein